MGFSTGDQTALMVTDLALAAADFARILRAMKFLQPGEVTWLGFSTGNETALVVTDLAAKLAAADSASGEL